jgi:hypothetical protein
MTIGLHKSKMPNFFLLNVEILVGLALFADVLMAYECSGDKKSNNQTACTACDPNYCPATSASSNSSSSSCVSETAQCLNEGGALLPGWVSKANQNDQLITKELG